MPTRVITHGAPSMPSPQATGSQSNHFHFHFHQQQSSFQSHSPVSDEGTVNQEIEPGENEPALSTTNAAASQASDEAASNEPPMPTRVITHGAPSMPSLQATGSQGNHYHSHFHQQQSSLQSHSPASVEGTVNQEIEPGENEPALSNAAASSSAAQNGPAQFDPSDYLEVLYEWLEPSKQAQTKVITLSLQCTEPNCPDTFGKNELDRHMSEKHLLRQFRCEVKDCRKSFDRWLTRQNHIKHAHKLTRFDCDKCAKDYSSYHKLSTHKYRCHQLGQFRCAVPSCTFEAVSISQITDHSKQQHKQTLYCGHGDCEYQNIAPRNVMSHRRKHTAVEPYRCAWPACGYASKQRENAIRHIQSKHSIPNAGSVQIGVFEIGSDEEEGEDEADGKPSEDNESGPAAKRPRMEPTQPARGVIIGESSRQPIIQNGTYKIFGYHNTIHVLPFVLVYI